MARDEERTQAQSQQAHQELRTAEVAERQRDLLNRLLATIPTGNGPELLKELAGSLGFPAAQEGVQEAQEARPVADPALGEGTGPKKISKQARIKSQGPYARPGESVGGAAARSASTQGTQDEGSPGGPADRDAEGTEAEQL